LVPITQIVSKFIESNKDTEVIETNKIGVEHNINSLDDKLTKTLPVAIEPTQNTSDILSDLLDIFVTPVESNQNPILPVGVFDDPPDIFVTPVKSNQNPILPVGVFDDPPDIFVTPVKSNQNPILPVGVFDDPPDIFVTPVESNQNPILPVGIFDDPPQKIILDTTPKPPPKKSYEDIKQDIMKMYYMRY
jgi:hypothetical protein